MSGRGIIDALIRAAFRANTTQPTLSSAGLFIPPWVDLAGRIVTTGSFPPAVVSAGSHGPETLTISDASAHDLVAAPAGGSAVYVLALAASNTSGSAVRLDIREGTTVRISMALAASGGGYIMPFPSPWKLPAATALTAIANLTVTDIRVNFQYVVAVA